jgi:hypothetical protein
MTDRHALHLAEVLQMALYPTRHPASEPYPETDSIAAHESAIRTSMTRTALGLGAVAAGAALLWQLARSHR